MHIFWLQNCYVVTFGKNLDIQGKNEQIYIVKYPGYGLKSNG